MDMISYFNYVNSIEFDLNRFNNWKESQKELNGLIVNNKYEEVVTA